MPTEHDRLFSAAALPGHLAGFGEAAVYTDRGGRTTAVTVIVSPERRSVTDRANDRTVQHEIRLLIPNAAGGGYDSPQIEASVTIGSLGYVLQEELSRDGNGSLWRCVRISRMQHERRA